MTDRHGNVDHAVEAVSRLRRLLRDHEASGDADTPFHLGIREALRHLDAPEQEASTAA